MISTHSTIGLGSEIKQIKQIDTMKWQGEVSSHTLLGMWLIIHAGIKINPCYWGAAYDTLTNAELTPLTLRIWKDYFMIYRLNYLLKIHILK